MYRLIHGHWCVYCGQIADSWDHFPPMSVTMRGWKLPCCRECNSILGNRYPWQFSKRCRLIKETLARKYRGCLETPIWYRDEIDTLGPKLKARIEQWQKQKRLVHARIAWNVDEHLRCIAGPRNFAAINATTPGTTSEELWRSPL